MIHYPNKLGLGTSGNAIFPSLFELDLTERSAVVVGGLLEG